MERNIRCSSFVRMRNPTSLFSLGLWRNKAVMAAPEQKAFCVLQFGKHGSVVSVQRVFRRQFYSDPPSSNSIRRWYQQFQTTGCLCKEKMHYGCVCQKKTWNEWESLFFAVRKNLCAVRVVNWICRVMTVWRVMRKILHMKRYRLYLLQFLKPIDHIDRSNVCVKM